MNGTIQTLVITVRDLDAFFAAARQLHQKAERVLDNREGETVPLGLRLSLGDLQLAVEGLEPLLYGMDRKKQPLSISTGGTP